MEDSAPDDGRTQTNPVAELAEVQKQRSLQPDEQTTLDHLMSEAQQMMLYKAEAYRVLAQRGHILFSSADVEQTS